MRILYAILACGATIACSQAPHLSDVEARRLSDAVISREYNIKDLTTLKVTVRGNADSWTFIYDPIDENSLGGPFMVKVDKVSGKVIDHGGYQ
jgi:hypothetical protein